MTFDPRKDWESWSAATIWRVWDGKIAEKVWLDDPAYKMVATAATAMGRSILDVGSGGGIQYLAFQEFSHKPIYYVGVDIHPGMVAYARKTFPNVGFYEGDARALSYHDNQFEVVVIRHVVEHHPPGCAESVLSEAVRVARRGVVVLFFKPPSQLRTGVNVKRGKRFYVNHYSAEWVTETLRSLSRNCKISTTYIPKSKTSPALNNQELWTCRF